MKTMEQNYTVILFYKYTHIPDTQAFYAEERERCQRLGIKGRMIIAEEGINGIYETTTENVEKYIAELTNNPLFTDVQFKKSPGNGHVFPRLSIKVRKEIVSLHLGNNEDFNPADFTAQHLKPTELHEWFNKKEDFVIVDMRNDYEHIVGHFKNSVLPPLKTFRDLPKVLPKLEHLKGKKVLTVCTGGVRCEKASGYLLKRGFKDVYQLDGGMVSYMEQYPMQNYNGAMYTFDTRKVIDYDHGQHEIIGRCTRCKGKTENYVDCINMSCPSQFLECTSCFEKKGKLACSLGCRLIFWRDTIKTLLKNKYKHTQTR